MKTTSICSCMLVAALWFGQTADAEIVIDIVESGGNVQATLSGSFDLDALGLPLGPISTPSSFEASTGEIGFNTTSAVAYLAPSEDGVVPFGTGTEGFWDETSGDAFLLGSGPVLAFPTNYVSGDLLSGSATEFGTDFATLGFTPGSYVTNYVNGSVSDSVTVNVGVPEPSLLAVSGVIGIAACGHRRRNRPPDLTETRLSRSSRINLKTIRVTE